VKRPARRTALRPIVSAARTAPRRESARRVAKRARRSCATDTCHPTRTEKKKTKKQKKKKKKKKLSHSVVHLSPVTVRSAAVSTAARTGRGICLGSHCLVMAPSLTGGTSSRCAASSGSDRTWCPASYRRPPLAEVGQPTTGLQPVLSHFSRSPTTIARAFERRTRASNTHRAGGAGRRVARAM